MCGVGCCVIFFGDPMMFKYVVYIEQKKEERDGETNHYHIEIDRVIVENDKPRLMSQG